MPEERLLNANRNCINCAKSDTCWAYHEILDKLDRWAAAGFAGAGAPGYKGDVFTALANACLHFEFKKLKNTNG